MKKETFIAVFLGVFLGIVVGVAILFQTTKPDGEGQIDQPEINLAQNVQNKNQPFIQFTLEAPEDGATFREDTISIQGNASKESLIVIQSPISNAVITTEDETFNEDFPLAIGENVINVTYYPKGSPNDYQERTLRVYYLPE